MSNGGGAMSNGGGAMSNGVNKTGDGVAGGVEIAVLRHGPTSWNRDGRLQGRTDIPLAPDALEEAARRRLPPPWDAARLIASPLSRAAETARRVSGGAEPALDARLVEADWGAWEGLRGADLAADPSSGFRPIEEWGWDYRAPNGESPRDMRARLAPLLRERLAAGERALLVCHLGVMRCLLAQAHGWDYAGPAPFRVKRWTLYPFRLGAGGAPQAPGDPVKLTRAEAGE